MEAIYVDLQNTGPLDRYVQVTKPQYHQEKLTVAKLFSIFHISSYLADGLFCIPYTCAGVENIVWWVYRETFHKGYHAADIILSYSD